MNEKVMTSQEICEKHNMRAVMIGYKDKSKAIHLSTGATYQDCLQLLLEIFGKEE